MLILFAVSGELILAKKDEFADFRNCTTQHMQMETQAPKPIRGKSYRWIENGHIFLWLIKDTCWAMEWRIGGLIMIAPTLSVAVYLLWRSAKNRAELFHNTAVCLWITANSVWMTGEFFKKELRPIAVVIFLIGLLLLVVYYLFYFITDKKSEETTHC